MNSWELTYLLIGTLLGMILLAIISVVVEYLDVMLTEPNKSLLLGIIFGGMIVYALTKLDFS